MTQPINLFIDTNILLSFYHFTNDDIAELDKLVAAVTNKEVVLWMPTQVNDEFYRNREAKLHDALKEYQKFKGEMSHPGVVKTHEQFNELKELLSKAGKVHKSIIDQLYLSIKDKTLKADRLTKSLFDVATEIQVTDKIYTSANKRMTLGNPPGKRGSFGDAINWESLLSPEVPENTNLYFVTNDSDYSSVIDKDSFNDFLLTEWSNKKKGKINYYLTLTSFFKSALPEIQIYYDKKKETAIQELEQSGSFSKTHKVISKLMDINDFNQSEVERLVESAMTNNQISSLLEDSDVHSFYSMLVQKYPNYIDRKFITEFIGEYRVICDKCHRDGLSLYSNVCSYCNSVIPD